MVKTIWKSTSLNGIYFMHAHTGSFLIFSKVVSIEEEKYQYSFFMACLLKIILLLKDIRCL